jgi:transposase
VRVELPETIEECHSLISRLLLVIEKQQAEIEELKAAVRELNSRLNQNSQNSHRPPSSDGFQKPKPAFSKKKKRRGGQLGHRGKTLERIAEPEVVIDCEPLECVCGKPHWTPEVEIAEARQVFDLPEPRLQVSEYRRIKRVCGCGRIAFGEFPEKVVAPVQYGEKVQTLVALLSVHGCLPFRKIGQMFADIYGYQLNEATAQEMLKRTSQVIPMAEIKAGVIASKVVNFDETGIKENGKLKWLHNASTEKWTYQFVDRKRGGQAMRDETSVLPNFKGVAVHDCWGSYFRFDEMNHAICGAHILRELTGIIETSESKWAVSMKQLLMRMYRKSDFGKGIIRNIRRSEKSYDEILSQAEKEEPPPEKREGRGKMKRTKGRNLLERLRKHKAAVLRFAKEKEVPFTNNQAERDIRPAKIKQKMNGGFRAASGTQSYCRINSFISSLRKQSRQVFQELLSVIEGKRFEIYQT